MTRDGLLAILRSSPIVASVQASEGSPLEDASTLLRLARASQQEGVRVLRLQGAETISLIRGALGMPTIGLVKRSYPGSSVYITPTTAEVQELLATECEVVALDGTARPRPGGEDLGDLVAAIHSAGRLAMADCDSLESARHALKAGADILGTTLAGYTGARPASPGPDLELLRDLVGLGAPVLAEGRFSRPEEVLSALRIGAVGVVIGGALNDPVKQTRLFVSAAAPVAEDVGAFDIGGTWMRFGFFSPDWRLLHSKREALMPGREDRLAWMRERVERHGLRRIGVSTGGTVDPETNTVWEAKPLIPDHVGTDFAGLADSVVALNDGLAAAWGHACLPQFAGKRVATLALGTGVGCGFVEGGRIWMGSRGEYPRLNDLAATGGTVEELLGGASLGQGDTDRQRAQSGFEAALQTLESLYFPDVMILCGGVGLADWLPVPNIRVQRSPFGADAGLYGAAALALFPPCRS